MPIDMRDLSRNLSQVIERMLTASRALDNAATAEALEHQAATLRKGLVRIALIGRTSSGKSTILNALLRSLVVPENPSVCSPVPVWISYRVGKEIQVEVVRRGENKNVVEKTDADTFMTQYCYNVSDLADVKRIRFKDLVEASVALESDVLRTGAILIDTLGIGATAVDTLQTVAALNKGVDLVIFAFSNEGGEVIPKNEVQFLREYVLGYEQELRQVSDPLDPKNLLLVYNDFRGTAGRDTANFVAGARSLFAGTAHLQSDEEYSAWVQSNVFDVNALSARLLRCGEAYPYDRLAPAGSSERAKDDLMELKEEEDDRLKACRKLPPEEQEAAFGMAALEQGILNHVQRRVTGTDSIALARIYELQQVLKQIRGTANARIKTVTMDAAQWATKKQDIQAIAAQLTQSNEDMQSVLMDNLRRKYIKSFNTIFNENYGKDGPARRACKGAMLKSPMPDTFREGFDLSSFLAMPDSEKVKVLDPYVNDMVDQITELCRDTVKTYLQENRGNGKGVSTPLDVLEESRVYIGGKGKSLNDYIKKLKSMDVQALGVMLPAENEVEMIYKNLQSELETRLLQAVSDALSSGRARFDTQRANYIHHAVGGVFAGLVAALRGFLGLVTPQKKLWRKVCSDYLAPLVDSSLDALGSFNQPGVDGGLYDQVANAYMKTKSDIEKRCNDILVALDHSQIRVDEQIAAQGQASDQTRQQMQQVLTTCDALEQELNGYQTMLLQ